MTLDPKITMKITQYNQWFKWSLYVTTLEKSLYGTGQNGAIVWIPCEKVQEKRKEIYGICFAY